MTDYRTRLLLLTTVSFTISIFISIMINCNRGKKLWVGAKHAIVLSHRFTCSYNLLGFACSFPHGSILCTNNMQHTLL